MNGHDENPMRDEANASFWEGMYALLREENPDDYNAEPEYDVPFFEEDEGLNEVEEVFAQVSFTFADFTEECLFLLYQRLLMGRETHGYQLEDEAQMNTVADRCIKRVLTLLLAANPYILVGLCYEEPTLLKQSPIAADLYARGVLQHGWPLNAEGVIKRVLVEIERDVLVSQLPHDWSVIEQQYGGMLRERAARRGRAAVVAGGVDATMEVR